MYGNFGSNAFTEARFAQMLSEINADYPTAAAQIASGNHLRDGLLD